MERACVAAGPWKEWVAGSDRHICELMSFSLFRPQIPRCFHGMTYWGPSSFIPIWIPLAVLARLYCSNELPRFWWLIATWCPLQVQL